MTRLLIAFFMMTLSLGTWAEQKTNSQRFGNYELYHMVLPTEFLQPDVAAAYGITRGKHRAMINLSLREYTDKDQTVPRHMSLNGVSRDLLGKTIPLDFRVVEERGAVYYIAEFRFINEEWRHFELQFSPNNSEQDFSFDFKQQLFKETP